MNNFLKSEYAANEEQLEKLKAELLADFVLTDAALESHWKVKSLLPPDQELLLYLFNYYKCEDPEDAPVHKANFLEGYAVAESYKARENQLQVLSEWEKNINEIDGLNSLIVENTVDLTGPPENFTYVNDIKPVGIVVPNDPPIGCDCKQCSCKSNCSCGKSGGFFAYTHKGRIRVDLGTPIFECNKACKCSADCGNRVVQKGRSIKLCIFKTSNGRGWGVKALTRIPKDKFVCQYIGELITAEEANKRGKVYDAQNRTYLFDLDFDCNESKYTLDAAHFGNVSHFINHSCDPNLGVWAVWSDCLDPNIHMLALFTVKEVAAGEELCFDYLQESDQVKDGEETSCNGTPKKPKSPTKTSVLTECKCNAKKCRKFVFDCIL